MPHAFPLCSPPRFCSRLSPRRRPKRIETVTVTGDRVHLIETRPDDTALGLAKPLLETPRAVTVVSDTTIDRYGVTGVDTLTAITPSAYTASFYGVEGAVNLRGTLAESYFRGFKRAENRGTYSTPLGDAAEIEILRGPPSAIYGAGKVGGLVNFVPKSVAASEDSIVSGEVTATYGSYSKRNLTGQIGVPLDLGCACKAACMPMARSTIPSAFIAASIPAISCWNCPAISPPAPGRCRRITCITIPMAMCRRRAGTG